jgi:adenine-specific DNA methylase
MTNDRRLIEDYLPIQAISAEASREKSVRKGHISTLHLWWATRPLVACRAAVYCALAHADLRDVVSGRLGPAPELVRIQNPAVRLDHAKQKIVTARFFEIPAEAVALAARSKGGAA